MVQMTEWYSCIFKKKKKTLVACFLAHSLYLHLQAHHACSSKVMKLCIIPAFHSTPPRLLGG